MPCLCCVFVVFIPKIVSFLHREKTRDIFAVYIYMSSEPFNCAVKLLKIIWQWLISRRKMKFTAVYRWHGSAWRVKPILSVTKSKPPVFSTWVRHWKHCTHAKLTSQTIMVTQNWCFQVHTFAAGPQRRRTQNYISKELCLFQMSDLFQITT